MRIISLLLALLIGILIAVIAIINNDIVTVNYLLGEMNLTLFMLILGSALAGAMFMVFLSLFRSIHKYMKSQGDCDYKKVLEERIKLLESQTRELEGELSKQQQELKEAAEKAYADLKSEKKDLEEELKMKPKEHNDITL